MAVDTGVLPTRYAHPRQIGRGGMGDIYLAEDAELARDVAVKLLGERFATDPALRARFKREALTAARLSGEPHVVTIFDVGEWRGRPFIVMEYMPGGTVAERARQGPVRHEEALSWLAQAAEALDAAHEKAVVHRDVKPANLLFDSRDTVKVADFGIARVMDDSTGGMTAAGTVMGTAGYLAPEQARGQPVTPASDRYALAVVAYELLTGGRPFDGRSETEEAAAHIYEPVPPASARGVGLPASIDRVFERALAKEPSQRYPTASAFVAALESALRATDRTRPLPVPPPAAARSEPVWAEPPPRRRSSIVPVLVGVAFALALAGGGVAALVTTAGGESPEQADEPRVVTEKVTVTREGEVTTVPRTVTLPSPPPPAAETTEAAATGLTAAEAAALNDEAFVEHMQRGDYAGALPLLRRAVPALRGTYSDSFRYEAYAEYNLGKTLVELGRCDAALPHLEQSEQLQGEKEAITTAKRDCGA